MLRILLFLFSSILFTRCANIVPPTGGPRDIEAPKLKSEYPKNGTTNYKENYITLTFDEPIVDNQLSSKVIVSPTIEGNYSVKIKKNTVRLSWKDTLKPNTTYTFNLADGIKDNTESNKINNYSVTFSTGKDIDSNKIEATIKNKPGSIPTLKMKLLLYPKTDSLLSLLKVKPEYIGQSNDSGKVVIKYIKKGIYQSIAILDDNNNNKWDITEAIDSKEIEVIEKNYKEYDLQQTILDTTKIISINNKNKTINILISRGLQNLSISDSNGFYTPTKINSRKYSIENQYKLEDSTQIDIKFIDSMGISGEYNRMVQFKNTDFQRFKDTLININNINRKYTLKPGIDSILYSTDRLIDTVIFNIESASYIQTKIKNNVNGFTLIVSGQKEKDSIKLTIPYKSIRSIYDEFNPEYIQQLTTGQEIDYGNLSFEIKTSEKNYHIYLENNIKKIIYTAKDKSINKIKNLEPGSYTLYVMVDTNGNGYWDAFDPINSTPAEPIYYFKENINIRANWDLEDIQMIF